MTTHISSPMINYLTSGDVYNDPSEFIRYLSLVTPLLDVLSNTVFFVKDLEARYIFVNNTLLTRLGLRDKEQLLGLTSEVVFPGLQGREYTMQDNKVLAGRSVVDKLELHTYPSGRLGWCLTHKIPICNKEGRVIAMAGVSIDVDKDSRHLRHHERLGRVVDYIQQHIDARLTVAELAEYAEMSISQLERMFKSILNLSPSQMIQKMRLELAINLLTHSDSSITQIAGRCGYGDHSAFSRQFRQLTGLSPRDLRRMNV